MSEEVERIFVAVFDPQSGLDASFFPDSVLPSVSQFWNIIKQIIENN